MFVFLCVIFMYDVLVFFCVCVIFMYDVLLSVPGINCCERVERGHIHTRRHCKTEGNFSVFFVCFCLCSSLQIGSNLGCLSRF